MSRIKTLEHERLVVLIAQGDSELGGFGIGRVFRKDHYDQMLPMGLPYFRSETAFRKWARLNPGRYAQVDVEAYQFDFWHGGEWEPCEDAKAVAEAYYGWKPATSQPK